MIILQGEFTGSQISLRDLSAQVESNDNDGEYWLELGTEGNKFSVIFYAADGTKVGKGM